MSLFDLSEVDERKAMQSLFTYIHKRGLGEADERLHRFDSTWEQYCRFLLHFDPDGAIDESPDGTQENKEALNGTTPSKGILGYKVNLSKDQILAQISNDPLPTLPCLEVFLDVALSMNTHLFGRCLSRLNEPLVCDPEILPVLTELGLTDDKRSPARAIVVDTIDRWSFFDRSNGKQPKDVEDFIRETADEAWQQASPAYRAQFIERPNSNWLDDVWRFGHWLSEDHLDRRFNLFGSNRAMGFLMMKQFQQGLDDGTYES